jgi:hypothetical protein
MKLRGGALLAKGRNRLHSATRSSTAPRAATNQAVRTRSFRECRNWPQPGTCRSQAASETAAADELVAFWYRRSSDPEPCRAWATTTMRHCARSKTISVFRISVTPLIQARSALEPMSSVCPFNATLPPCEGRLPSWSRPSYVGSVKRELSPDHPRFQARIALQSAHRFNRRIETSYHFVSEIARLTVGRQNEDPSTASLWSR